MPAGYRAAETTATHLERYATYFDCVEINSTFSRTHRFETFVRWAAGVPSSFRFSAKLPRGITHDRRLCDCEDAIAYFCATVAGLGVKLGALLVQLPPSLNFDEFAAEVAFRRLGRETPARIVCEARHSSWFSPEVDRFLAAAGVTRVIADPCRHALLESPVADAAFSYRRLHGKPRTYYSPYTSANLLELASRLQHRPRGAEAWCIFDNTTLGAAWPNALELKDNLQCQGPRPPAG